jgi:hypothetical protein
MAIAALRRQPTSVVQCWLRLVGSVTASDWRRALLDEPLAQRRAYFSQPFQGTQDLRLIVGEMAHDYVGVTKFP